MHGVMDELAHAEYHLIKDALTPERETQELIDDQDSQAFGYDRYRTDSLYDSLDRIDSSIHLLMDKRNEQTYRLH